MEDYSNWLEKQIGQTAKTLQKIRGSSTTNKLAQSMKNTCFKPKTAVNSDGEEIIVELQDKEGPKQPPAKQGRDDDFEDIHEIAKQKDENRPEKNIEEYQRWLMKERQSVAQNKKPTGIPIGENKLAVSMAKNLYKPSTVINSDGEEVAQEIEPMVIDAGTSHNFGMADPNFAADGTRVVEPAQEEEVFATEKAEQGITQY